jgi:choline-sulfatase
MLLPHCPFIAPKNLFDYYYERVDIPRIVGDVPPTIRRFRKLRGILEPLPDERIRVARAAYYGMCEYLDLLIGRILDCLDETGLSENTLVVYTTDHGEMAGDHGCWWKSNYYEGSVGVPLIARLPGFVPASSVSQAICSLMDLGPTFSEIAGTEMLDVDGRSIWSILRGNRPSSWLNETCSEFCDGVGDLYLPSRMIRSGRWKLWVYPDQERLPPTLFDLNDDPLEQHDLGNSPALAKVRDQLLSKVLSDWDPETVHREGRQAVADWGTLSRWANQTLPENPDAVEIPPPSLEANVELL